MNMTIHATTTTTHITTHHATRQVHIHTTTTTTTHTITFYKTYITHQIILNEWDWPQYTNINVILLVSYHTSPIHKYHIIHHIIYIPLTNSSAFICIFSVIFNVVIIISHNQTSFSSSSIQFNAHIFLFTFRVT